MEKIYSLIEKGLVDEKSLLQEKSKKSPRKNSSFKEKTGDADFEEQAEVGDQGFIKKKKQPV